MPETPAFFVAKTNASGGARYYWQPSATLHAAGWRTQRLDQPANRRDQAVAQAVAINAAVGRWRSLTAGAVPATPAGPMSFADLVDAYTGTDATAGSPEFMALARHRDSSQAQYRRAARRLRDRFGGQALVAISKSTVAEFYRDEHFRAPAMAAQMLAVLRVIMAYGVRSGWLTDNPAAAPQIQHAKPRWQVWTWDEIEAVDAAARATGFPSIGIACQLGFFLGLRQGDILGLTWFQYRKGKFQLRTRKTQVLVEVPAVPRLARALDALDRATPAIVTHEGTGRAWNQQTFRTLLAPVKSAAAERRPALVDKMFRDLRRTAVVNLYDQGCTVPQVAAVTGHTIEAVTKIVDWYFVPTAKQAEAAMVNLSDWSVAQ